MEGDHMEDVGLTPKLLIQMASRSQPFSEGNRLSLLRVGDRDKKEILSISEQ